MPVPRQGLACPCVSCLFQQQLRWCGHGSAADSVRDEIASRVEEAERCVGVIKNRPLDDPAKLVRNPHSCPSN
jgi:hypothetical protein